MNASAHRCHVTLTIYVMLQFALLLGMSMHFLALVPVAGVPTLLAYAAYLVVSLGVLMEGRRWAIWIEAARVTATALVPALSGA